MVLDWAYLPHRPRFRVRIVMTSDIAKLAVQARRLLTPAAVASAPHQIGIQHEVHLAVRVQIDALTMRQLVGRRVEKSAIIFPLCTLHELLLFCTNHIAVMRSAR